MIGVITLATPRLAAAAPTCTVVVPSADAHVRGPRWCSDHPEDPVCTRDNDFRLNVLNYGPRAVAPVNLPAPAELEQRFP